jgi:tryptophan synthase beta subunit
MNSPQLHLQTHEGRYGRFGGAYMPELLVPALQDLQRIWKTSWASAAFRKRFHHLLTTYAGRPTPLTEVVRFSQSIGGPRIYLKREDLLHTGAHKLNNALGQCLLAQMAGKTRIIAETGAGQHGVATATACARLGLECVVYMGVADIERQKPNVDKMRLLGARVASVKQGLGTLKEAINEAFRDWSFFYETTYYCIGSALGPHPYPEIVREFQSIIGLEVKEQIVKQAGQQPDVLVACVGGGSNAIGLFAPFLEDTAVRLIGVEAGGSDMQVGSHAARFAGGSPGVFHGSMSYLLQDPNGQVLPTQSVSAGLDYPAVGPQHANLFESKRANYVSASDDEAVQAFQLLSKTEGIIPALESSHALGYLLSQALSFHKDDLVIVNLSGRGDKDLPHLFEKKLISDRERSP